MSPHEIALSSLGWNAFFESNRSQLRDGVPGRVAAHHGASLVVVTSTGSVNARVAGKLRHSATSALHMPAVGDWVGLRRSSQHDAVIDVVLPRSSQLMRQAAGSAVGPQVIAANVDVVAIVLALGADFNARRLERYLSVVEPSGATAMVLLAKVDLCADPESHEAAARSSAPGVPVLTLSAVSGQGLDALRERLRPGLTAALVGSSGVGKSTLVNALLGADVQRTGAVREHDDRGRHITTHRELFALPGGALVVDTPGMRELSAWAGDGARDGAAFDDIADIGTACRFADCAHDSEPGCAVAAAIARGELEVGRLENFRKLGRELAFQARREDQSARRAEVARWKSITKSMRGFTKEGR